LRRCDQRNKREKLSQIVFIRRLGLESCSLASSGIVPAVLAGKWAQFKLDEADLEALKADLIEGQQVATDEGGKVLVWRGASATVSPASKVTSSSPSADPSAIPALTVSSVPDAERRQLTLRSIFCIVSFPTLC
jgi:hypothetical protein